jgi:hypothetical protein
MAYERGEIYFVRESIHDQKDEQSPYVKIGLIRFNEDNRDSFGRLREHQTGNPRKLFIKKTDIVETDAVDRVEAMLHRVYAHKRIQGEWFKLETESEIQAAVLKAKELAQEVSEIVPIFEAAEKLKVIISNGLTKPQEEKDLEIAKSLAVAKVKLSTATELKKEINELLTVIREAGGDVSAVAKTVLRTFSPKFDEKLFKEQNELVWEAYAVEISAMSSPRFTEKIKLKLEDLELDFKNEISDIKAQIELARNQNDVTLLNEPNLRLTNIEGMARWDQDIAVATLKVSTGEYDGIQDICNWKRKMTVTKKLNEGLLIAEEEELYKKYIFTPDPQEYVIAKVNKVK